MSEDLFKNPSTNIPDEMWRAPAPVQRQIDAAVMWAELTGKNREEDERQAAEDSLREELSEKGASATESAISSARWIAQNPQLFGAAVGAPVGAASSLYSSSKLPSGASRAEAKLMARKAALDKQQELSGEDSPLARRLLESRMTKARFEKDNRAAGALLGAGIGAGQGALAGHLAKHPPTAKLRSFLAGGKK